MTIKRSPHIILFIGLLLLLLAFLFIFEDSAVDPATFSVIIGGYPGKSGEVERIDVYAMFHTVGKVPAIDPGEKEKPDPEPVPPPPPVTARVAAATSLNQKEQQMVGLINEARSSAGLPTLQVSCRLTEAARAKSRDMANNNYFSHNSPTYGSFTSLLRYYGITYRAAGENLAMNSSGSVSSAHNNLMNSAGHRANILGRQFSHVGVGIHVRSDGTHFYTQLFVGY